MSNIYHPSRHLLINIRLGNLFFKPNNTMIGQPLPGKNCKGKGQPILKGNKKVTKGTPCHLGRHYQRGHPISFFK